MSNNITNLLNQQSIPTLQQHTHSTYTVPYDANGSYYSQTFPQTIKYVYKSTFITAYKTKAFHIVCDLQPSKLNDINGYKLKSMQFHEEKKAVSILFEKANSLLTVKTAIKNDELVISFRMADDNKPEETIIDELESFKDVFINIVNEESKNCNSCLHGSMYMINAKCDKNYDKLLVDFTDEE